MSESLRRGSRNFQLACQIGLLTQRAIVDGIARDARLTSDESRSLCRAVLGNDFAGALLMPYDRFLDAARTERYDIEVLGNRFRTSFEQVCHRLTTLRLCERTDCEQRAFPAVQHPMKIDENVRGASFYAPVERPLDV